MLMKSYGVMGALRVAQEPHSQEHANVGAGGLRRPMCRDLHPEGGLLDRMRGSAEALEW